MSCFCVNHWHLVDGHCLVARGFTERLSVSSYVLSCKDSRLSTWGLGREFPAQTEPKYSLNRDYISLFLPRTQRGGQGCSFMSVEGMAILETGASLWIDRATETSLYNTVERGLTTLLEPSKQSEHFSQNVVQDQSPSLRDLPGLDHSNHSVRDLSGLDHSNHSVRDLPGLDLTPPSPEAYMG